MPAPSPVLASHPHAPRCSRLIRTRSALRTISWERRPYMSTTKPTPHASCSALGLYMPWASGAVNAVSSGLDARTSCAMGCKGMCRLDMVEPLYRAVTHKLNTMFLDVQSNLQIHIESTLERPEQLNCGGFGGKSTRLEWPPGLVPAQPAPSSANPLKGEHFIRESTLEWPTKYAGRPRPVGHRLGTRRRAQNPGLETKERSRCMRQ